MEQGSFSASCDVVSITCFVNDSKVSLFHQVKYDGTSDRRSGAGTWSHVFTSGYQGLRVVVEARKRAL